MTKTVLKNELVKAIRQIQDEKLLQSVYHFLNCHLRTDEYELTDEDKAELDRSLARDKAGLEKGYSWEEVKSRILKGKKSKTVKTNKKK